MESVYGIYCFLFHSPSYLVENSDFNLDETMILAREYYQEKRKVQNAIKILSRDLTKERELNFLFHGYIVTQEGFLIGEYAQNSARIFVKNIDKINVIDFYQKDPGVRHIHSILCSDTTLFISTGDSKKYLDQWELIDDEIVFTKRILNNFFGGFTGCSKVQNMHFFASDFSRRPNYIYCLETREKYFFPKPAYNQVCSIMLPVKNRYIFCIFFDFHQVSVAIFDTQYFLFVYCQTHSANDEYFSKWPSISSL